MFFDPVQHFLGKLAILDGEELIFRFAKAVSGFVGQVYGLGSCKFDKIDALFFQTTEVDCPPNGPLEE
jgi:hypothetical protein